MPPFDFISSGRSVRKRLPLEKFVDYTHCCESSISFAVFSRHLRMSTLEIVLGSKR